MSGASVVGLDPRRLARAVDVVRATSGPDPRTCAFPGAVVAVASRGTLVVHEAIGQADLETSPSRAMNVDAVFDLASLTKVLVTTTLALQMLDAGAFSLDDRLDQLDPALSGTWLAELTPGHLLTHTSGAPWVSAFAPDDSWLARAADARPAFAPGAGVEYSCTNFLLLQRILERHGGQTLDLLFARDVAAPLGLDDICFLSLDRPIPESFAGRLIPTEARASSDRGLQLGEVMSVHPRFAQAFRARHTSAGRARGVVHDENAAALGGVAGNAGLFGTARAVLAIGMLYASGGITASGTRLLSPAAVALATRPHTRSGLDPRGLGWQLPARGTLFGDLAPASCFGHTGFTGTALWVDPEHDLVAVLLTNRLQFGRTNDRVLRVRRLFFNALQAALA